MSSFMLLLHTASDRARQFPANTDFTQVTREYMAWADGMREKGYLKAGNKLTNDAGKILSGKNGRIATSDGPYAESKEIVGGFFIISARDYTEACRLAESCPHVKWGSYVEVRQVEEL